jgi:hypothetical protein
MAPVRRNVTAFVTIIGQDCTRNPYSSQSNTPVENVRSMASETSSADRVVQVRWSCGQKAAVVKAPAVNPIVVTNSIDVKSFPGPLVSLYQAVIASGRFS